MNITKQMVLSSHQYYDDQTLGRDNKTVHKLQGNGWIINDLFKEYCVINETKHTKPPSYIDFDVTNETTWQEVFNGPICFFFDGSVRESNYMHWQLLIKLS
jgi:hypothetical protein